MPKTDPRQRQAVQLSPEIQKLRQIQMNGLTPNGGRRATSRACPNRRNHRALGAIGVLALVTAAGCNDTSILAPQSSPAVSTASVPAVQIVKPLRKTVQRRFEQPGFNIEAFQETPLHSKIAGYVGKWNVDIGDPVHKDDLLAVLFAPEMTAAVNQKRAAVRHAAAQIKQAKATMLTAHAQLDRSKSQYERLTRVGKAGVLDQEAIDETRLGYEAAQASLMKAKADVETAEAQLDVAKADLDYANAMLEYTNIRAPYDGVVTERNVNSGDFVQPATSGTKGRAIYVVNQINPVRVFVNVPGSDAPWIKDGDAVSLELQGAGGQVIQGKLTRNSRSLNPQARTLRTEIDLPNPDGKLMPGMYVQAHIIVQRENVWTLPESAIMSVGDQTYCFSVEDGKAVRTPLQMGLKGNGLVEVVMKQTQVSLSNSEQEWTQITGKEEVVAKDAASLANGQTVHELKADQ
jgi:HlyD family secretion protein